MKKILLIKVSLEENFTIANDVTALLSSQNIANMKRFNKVLRILELLNIKYVLFKQSLSHKIYLETRFAGGSLIILTFTSQWRNTSIGDIIYAEIGTCII